MKLTPTERKVVEHVCAGLSSQQVAAILGVAKRTIDYHLCNIYRKNEISNRVQLVHRATKAGVLDAA